ncbi:MAG TPA: molybdate ABC transporter permease subunit [Longimicrobiales bacterium]|nr:molybdate ABC transporter permease subunit [Longimicrobiales bacterium]
MTLPPLALSFWVALNATLLAILVGLPLAWVLSRKTLPARDLLTVLVLLPMVLPPTVLGYLLLVLLGQGGPVGQWAEAMGLGRIVFTRTAAVIAAFVASVPFLIRSAQAGFEQVDPSYEEAARTLGRSEVAIWFTVTLPLAWRAVLAGVALAFARAVGEFGATVMVAGSIPGRTRTGSVAIYDHVQAGRMDEAGFLALGLALAAAGALFVLTRVGRSAGW